MSRRLDRGASFVRLALLVAVAISVVLGWLGEPQAPRPGPDLRPPPAVPAPTAPEPSRPEPQARAPATAAPPAGRSGVRYVDLDLPLPAVLGRTRFARGTHEAGGLYTGTAFATARDGVWATARHVTDGCRRIAIRHGGGGFYVDRVVLDEATDLSLLIGPTGGALAPARGSYLPLEDDRLVGFAMGFPHGRQASVHLGYLARIAAGRPDSRGRARWAVAGLWQIHRSGLFDGPDLAGISGGPLFDRAGRLDGIVVGGQPRRARVVSIDPVNLTAFMKAAGTPPDKRGWTHPGLAPDNADAARRELIARGLLALVECRT